jgi:hypothetical protein
MKKAKQENPKKFSLDDFKAHAKTISSSSLLETITGGVEDACHVVAPSGPSGGSGGGSSFTKTPTFSRVENY